MKIKRFYAPDMRQALKKVRETLGPDTVILSNKRVPDGVELVTAIDYDPALLETAVRQGVTKEGRKEGAVPSSSVRPESNFERIAQQKRSKRAQTSQAMRKMRMENTRAKRKTEETHAALPERERSDIEMPVKKQPQVTSLDLAKAHDSLQQSLTASEDDPALTGMRNELKSLRSLLEHQLSGLAWGDMEKRSPLQMMVLRRLSELGLNAKVSRKVIKRVATHQGVEHAWRQALQIFSRMLRVTDDDILTDGGVIALLGATGVGKTTTVAKLAARYALRHGAQEVALITTDSYRIAAHEQLRTYGRILGVPVRMTSDAESLRSALYDFRHRHLVLIDTAGLSQRDTRLSEQLALLQEGGVQARRYLTLSATSQTSVLDESVNAFEREELDGCIITKLDETASLGEALSVAVQYELPVAYIADGQRVPEDLKVARAHNLINRALSLAQERNSEVGDEALAAMFAKGETV